MRQEKTNQGWGWFIFTLLCGMLATSSVFAGESQLDDPSQKRATEKKNPKLVSTSESAPNSNSPREKAKNGLIGEGGKGSVAPSSLSAQKK